MVFAASRKPAAARCVDHSNASELPPNLPVLRILCVKSFFSYPCECSALPGKGGPFERLAFPFESSTYKLAIDSIPAPCYHSSCTPLFILLDPATPVLSRSLQSAPALHARIPLFFFPFVFIFLQTAPHTTHIDGYSYKLPGWRAESAPPPKTTAPPNSAVLNFIRLFFPLFCTKAQNSLLSFQSLAHSFALMWEGVRGCFRNGGHRVIECRAV
jgi:hypothetical protein